MKPLTLSIILVIIGIGFSLFAGSNVGMAIAGGVLSCIGVVIWILSFKKKN